MRNPSHTKFTLPAAVAVMSFAALFGIAPAQAHDSLVSTSPADGETITEDPGVVSLTLTGEPQNSNSIETTIIEVTAGDGHGASTGEVITDGAVISTEVSLEHADVYTVDWRTLSADGHPIEGTYTFTYAPEGEAAHSEEEETAPAAEESTPAAEPAESTPAAEETSTADDAETVDAAPASDSGDDNTGMIIGIAAIALIIAAAAAYFLGRRAKTTGNHQS